MTPQDARSLSPDALFDLRTRVVAAVRGGMTRIEAARVFAVHRAAVGRWCRATGPGPAAELLDAVRTRHPDDLGVPDALWTRDAVAEYAAARFGVRRSRYVWGRWLRRHGFTPQRPARRAYQQDPAALDRWRAEVYPAIAAEAKAVGAEVHWLDETGLRTDHAPGTGYAPRGRPPVVRVSGRPHRVNVISTVTNAGRLRFSVFAGRLTAVGFVAFLGRLLRSTTGPVFLIADGHPVHRSRRVRDWVAAHADRLRLYFLPPYCPEVNPTEYLNNSVKGTVPRVQRARDREELAGQVRSYLRIAQRRPDIVRRFFDAKPVRYAA